MHPSTTCTLLVEAGDGIRHTYRQRAPYWDYKGQKVLGATTARELTNLLR